MDRISTLLSEFTNLHTAVVIDALYGNGDTDEFERASEKGQQIISEWSEMSDNQQLQDARAEIARLEEQYQTTRDLLEYRSGQYAAMSEVAGEAEHDDDEAWALVDWAANLLENLLEEARTERDEARRWAAAWKRAARVNRERAEAYKLWHLITSNNLLLTAELEIERLKAPQPCGHPGACIVVGEARGDGLHVHHCAWCADVERYREECDDARDWAIRWKDLTLMCWRNSSHRARAALESTE